MTTAKKDFCAVLFIGLFFINLYNVWGYSVPGPESDQHNTVYSYNISNVALEKSEKLHVDMNVHMCPYCSPHNNHVMVNVEGIGVETAYNLPVGTTTSRSFTFDASNLKVGDIVQINSEVWCEWCGSWKDSKKYRVEEKVVDTPGLGRRCELTLVQVGSSVNVGNGNLFDSHQASPDPGFPIVLSYNSRSSREGRFGFGWSSGADLRLVKKNDGSILMVEADGREENFTANADGTFTSPPGNRDRLELNKQVIFYDDMEGGIGRWRADAPWEQVSFSSHSPSISWTDSPNGNYANKIHKALTLPLDLGSVTEATMTFWHLYAFESNYDFGYIEISEDGGVNWTLLKSYTGTREIWDRQSVDLGSYVGLPDLLLRFRVITDSSVTEDGWHVDDVEIGGGEGYLLHRKGGEVLRFDRDGKLLGKKDRNGNETICEYEGDVLAAIAGPDGSILYLGDDGSGRVTEISEPSGKSYSFGYDPDGNLETIVDPMGGAWSFSYDDRHNLTRKVDPMGRATLYAYDEEDRLKSAVDAGGSTRSVDYFGSETTVIIDPAGNETEFTYNENLNVTRKVDALGNLTEYGWDSEMNRISVEDASGVVSYEYGDRGNMLSKTDQMGYETSYSYDAYGNVLTVVEPGGDRTVNVYDDRGNLVSTEDASGGLTTFGYDEQGRMTESTDAAGRTTRMVYDADGNLVAVTDPSGMTTRFEYDEAGNLVRQIDAEGRATSFEYDASGRPVKVIDSLGQSTLYAYDALGNKISEVDANGNATFFEYDHRGRMVKVTDAEKNATLFSYGESAGCVTCSGGADKLTSLTDANGNATIFEYDAMNRLIREVDPLGKTTDYDYDAGGNLVARTDPKGQTVAYRYDPLGRLLAKEYPDGSATSYSYDAKGRVLTAANEYAQYSFTYDASGRVASVVDSEGPEIAYEYDGVGRRISMVAPDGRGLRYEYDAAGRLRAILGGGDYLFSYDGLGRRASLAYPNGVVADYDYDRLGRLRGLVHRDSSGNLVTQSLYTHDAVGNRLSNATERRTTDYVYDRIYRLTEAVHSDPGFSAQKGRGKKGHGVANAVERQREFYVYDTVGNRNRTDRVSGYRHNGGNELLEADGTFYRNDENGNLVEKLLAEGTTVYRWDFENRLIEVVTPEGAVVSFKYDAFGRRIEKKIAGAEGEKVTRYFYDNEDVLFEYDEAGVIGNFYIHGPGIDEPLGLSDGKGTYCYHADGLGSVVALTDGQGRVVQSYEYNSFGNLHDMKNRIKQPYTYTGREFDRETGLYYYRARYYDAEVGRFVSEDPIGFEGGDVNLYVYVENQPVTFNDPRGLEKGWGWGGHAFLARLTCDQIYDECCRNGKKYKERLQETAIHSACMQQLVCHLERV